MLALLIGRQLLRVVGKFEFRCLSHRYVPLVTRALFKFPNPPPVDEFDTINSRCGPRVES